MERMTKWFVLGLVSFALGTIFVLGYFLTLTYESGNSGNQDVGSGHALTVGLILMPVGFIIAVVTASLT